MRPLVTTLVIALLAAACSVSGPASVGAGGMAGGEGWTAGGGWARAQSVRSFVAASEDVDSTEDDGVPSEENAEDDDADGDELELVGVLRTGASLERLHGALVRWDLRVDRVLLDHFASDLIRPPIRA